MLLAYVNFHQPAGDRLDLCIVPEKLDVFAAPIRVEALPLTTNAIVRVSSLEGIKVRLDDSDGGLIIAAVEPSKLFLTPSQPDLPGIEVGKFKIVLRSDSAHLVFFKPLMGSDTWKEWRPNDSQ